MGAFFEAVPQSLVDWIMQQKMFWVATAPLAAPVKEIGGIGHVNLSPKGGAYFGLTSLSQFWYMDLTGSGSETISHLHEPGNGRITVMFNAFEGPPRILRLFGHGTALESGTPQFEKFIKDQKVETIPGTRTIIIVDIHQVGTSCGFSVPYYDFKDFRPILNDHFKKKEARYLAGKEEESMPRYWALKNAYSMDGLPSMKLGLKSGKEFNVKPMKKMVGRFTPKNQNHYGTNSGFTLTQLSLVLLLGVFVGWLGANWGADARQSMQKLLGPVLQEARTRIHGVNVAIPSPAQIIKK